MLDKVGKYEFMAEPFHCDFSKRIFMGHLGNHLLNAADFHSNDRNFGMNYLNTINKTWVLSRLAIEMEEMPLSYTRFYVETWVENAMRFFTNRNFKVSDVETGKVYGYGRSVWAMIDTVTRQPADLFDVNNGDIANYVEKEKECPIAKSSRVRMSDEAGLVRTVDTFYSDVDVNGHINSILSRMPATAFHSIVNRPMRTRSAFVSVRMSMLKYAVVWCLSGNTGWSDG